MTTNRTVCQAHGMTNPCQGCAADHLLGEHADVAHKATCRKCRARARPAPLLDTVTHRPKPVIDVAALAANDTDLIEDV